MLTFLIYGHKGWIGQQFIDLLKLSENLDILYVLGNARADNVKDIETELSLIMPTNVISFIGRTHGMIDDKEYTTIDYLEQKGKLVENVRDNLFAPLSIAIACQKLGIHYTYLGTGCIFTYKNGIIDTEGNTSIMKCIEDNGFTEQDIPNFTGSGYSTVKGFTDMLMHKFEDTVLNLRIRMPIIGEDHSRNFITKITTYEKICSVENSMTVLSELIPIIIDLAKRKHIGTINLTNPGVISHNEILQMYKEIVDLNFKWENFTIEEQNQILESKRSNNYLDTTKLEHLYPYVLPIKQAVKKCLENWTTN